MDIEKYRVTGAPPTVYYIPNFITENEESHLLKSVYSAPRPKWTFLSNRRLQDYGGVPHEKGMLPEPIPKWLQTYMDKIDALNIFDGKKTNQVLVNEYLAGQGIMPHTDGPLFQPTISTISCGSHTVLEFKENSELRKKVCDILLEQRSLVIIKEELYSKYLHSISEREDDVLEDIVNLDYCGEKYISGVKLKRKTRVSLTIRNVPKVLKVKLFK
ncbi:unnamed protein product [Acanthoscelides obtectus]|uniref:Fe2OG dioxygenase domain-containing protein n=1 Tax=Acanthoscelides obtectus TaxID=200917 RepID=A0A9P0L949_ACAOB|nr:unnamed protein product [Acanthoscelides obtectus]CAK1650835.1 Alpha-ketoglutarate-dependent dioxygenase alkB homolog 6 [Acanthoscelides obtectus]